MDPMSHVPSPADALASGLRGRHLLLNLLADAESADAPPGELTPLNRLLGDLATEIDHADGSLEFLVDDPRVDELADFLRHAPPVDAAQLPLMRAVSASMDAAVYWQPRWEEDVLLTLPVFREALAPAAEQVAGAPTMDWWGDDLDPAQQVWPQYVNREGVPRPRPGTLAPEPGALDDWRKRILETETRLRGDREVHGDWWSAPALAAPSTARALPTHGASGLWWMEDTFGWRSAELVTADVDPDTRVYEIAEAADWVRLCRDYPLEVTWGRHVTWHECTGRQGRWLIPDWSRVARDFDAVHVTVLGYLGTAGEVLDLDDGFATLLAGWDPDETYWLGGSSRLSEESESCHRREGDDLWVRDAR